jgi:phosphopantothenoylcysteine decarboxylase/phosphopantothenate--cysteine ligase
MAPLAGRTVVLGISGSVAAYKAADIARRLMDAGAHVTAVLTAGAQQFITPLTFTALTGRPALTDPFHLPTGAMPHLELAKMAAAVVVAPASANILARAAGGLADDLLTAILLVTRAPVFIAPAMHEPMWTHPATQHHVDTLKGFGYRILGPATGALASGDQGMGRMLEPETIVAEVIRTLAIKT